MCFDELFKVQGNLEFRSYIWSNKRIKVAKSNKTNRIFFSKRHNLLNQDQQPEFLQALALVIRGWIWLLLSLMESDTSTPTFDTSIHMKIKQTKWFKFRGIVWSTTPATLSNPKFNPSPITCCFSLVLDPTPVDEHYPL